MTLAEKLLSTLRLHWCQVDAWLRQWLETPDCEGVAMAALFDVLLAAANGAAPLHGVYRLSFEQAYSHMTERRPDLVHQIGVSWRRSIPLPTPEQGLAVLDAYAQVYGARLLLHSSATEALTFARLAYYAAPVGLDATHFDTDQAWPYDVLQLLQAVSRILAGFSGRELARQPQARELRSLLHNRHYHWVTTQAYIRREQVSGPDKQDHHPCDPIEQEADHPSDHGRPLG